MLEHLPEINMVVIADIRGLGKHQVILIENKDYKKMSAFGPGMWCKNQGNHIQDQLCWKEVNNQFICKFDMVKS